MGRNSKSSKSSSPNSPFCEKLLKAFGISHPKIIKLSPSTSHHEQHQHQQQNNSSHHIYVHHEPPAIMEKMQSSKNKYGGDEDVNDVFSNYINRAKRRLGNIASKKHNNDLSSKGKENNLKAEDRRFSDYIVRARNKLRATSSSVGLTKTKSSSVK